MRNPRGPGPMSKFLMTLRGTCDPQGHTGDEKFFGYRRPGSFIRVTGALILASTISSEPPDDIADHGKTLGDARKSSTLSICSKPNCGRGDSPGPKGPSTARALAHSVVPPRHALDVLTRRSGWRSPSFGYENWDEVIHYWALVGHCRSAGSCSDRHGESTSTWAALGRVCAGLQINKPLQDLRQRTIRRLSIALYSP